jgi:hypothetical protein
MTIQISCKDCCSELKFPDKMAGQRVRCPRCDAVFTAPGDPDPPRSESIRKAAPVREKPASRSARATSAAPARDEEPAPKPKSKPTPKLPSDERIRSAPPARRSAESSTPARAGSTRPAAEKSADEPRSKPGKKKRRRKRPASRSSGWIWSLVAACFAVICIGGLAIGAVMNTKVNLMPYFIVLLILLPISMGILVLSMFITSAIGGGIDFGDARIAIPKAAVLLLVINIVSLSPLRLAGSLFTLPIWIIGLMGLFRLDWFETRIVLAVNWILNSIVRFVVIGALVSAAAHMKEQHPDDDAPDMAGVAEVSEQSEHVAAQIENLGGECTLDGNNRIVAVHLHGPQATDENLFILFQLPDLKSLDLSGSAVTDRGVMNLILPPKLRVLIVSNTRITAAAVDELRVKWPKLAITR